MLTFDPDTDEQLKGLTKTAWSAKLNELLGNSRRVLCYRDPDSAAVNPYLTGVKFLDIGNSGTMTAVSGIITKLGKLAGATTKLAADLNTGKSILRIEGNGRWVQGSVGLKTRNTDTNLLNDVDFTFSASPTATSGFAISAGLRPPRLRPTGIGPQAPGVDIKRPMIVEVEDCRDPNNPVIAATGLLNVRADDLVFEDLELAYDMGDVRITQLSAPLVFDDFEFGAILMSLNPVVNDQLAETLHQVLITCKPKSTRWESYPALDTWNRYIVAGFSETRTGASHLRYHGADQSKAIIEKITITAVSATTLTVVSDVNGAYPNITVGANDSNYVAPHGGFGFVVYKGGGNFVAGDQFKFEIKCSVSNDRLPDVTVPPPFKVRLRSLDNTQLHVFQMRDGLPINSPELSQVRTADKPLRPVFNCGMMLPWQSHRPKMNTKAYKFFPGMVPDSVRVSQCRTQYASNPSIPLLRGAEQINSYNHYFAAPKWAIGYALTPENNALDPTNDPYTWNIQTFETWTAVDPRGTPSRAVGWGYEPASISLHDWTSGPGGVRSDRGFISTALALYMNNPTGIRLRDGSTYLENVEAWNMAYYNHSCHYVRNAVTGKTLPVEDVLFGKYSYSDPYYGEQGLYAAYVPGGAAYHIPVHGVIKESGNSPLPKDRTGFPTWNGWNPDDQHAYSTPGWVVLLLNSPMFLVSAKHRLIAATMSSMGAVNPEIVNDFMGRVIAWRWLHWALAWKLGTQHELGVPRALIEKRWVKELENIHRDYVAPATDPTHANYNSDVSRGLRGLGMYPAGWLGGWQNEDVRGVPGATGNYKGNIVKWGALAFYMTGVFVLMEQSGCMDRLYSLGPKCAETLDFMHACYDKYSIEYFLDAKGRAEGNYAVISKPILKTVPNDEAAQSVDFHTIASSWAEWAQWYPPVGSEDWNHGTAGELINQRDAAQHGRSQWVYARENILKRNPHPRLAACVTQLDGWYAATTANVAAQTTPYNKIVADWMTRYPSYGRFKTPTVT